MNIGQISKACGLPVKTIRYYEEIDLIQPARDANGYRVFTEVDRHNLSFLSRARSLGFTIEECRTLLDLYRDDGRASADVKTIAEQHLADIDDKVAALMDMRNTLAELVQTCHGDDRPECPILNKLAGSKEI